MSVVSQNVGWGQAGVAQSADGVPSPLVMSPSHLLPAACPAGFFGVDCRSACNCTAAAPCDAVSGSCLCPAGRRGPRCAQSA